MPKPFYDRMFFSPDDGAGSGGGSATGTETVEIKTETTETKPDDRQELKDAIAKERKAADDARRELEAIKADQQKRKDDDAERQGEWQKLAEDRKAEIDKIRTDAEAEVATAKAEIARRDRDDRARAALKAANLDESLLSRIHGDTAEELKKDADDLAKLVKASAPKTPEGNGPNPHATGPTGDKADEAALKAHREAFKI